jgi:HD-GYP domain-containing protein (c-di-GMP phosphodiesterase class II)
VGKIGVGDRILKKPGPLSAEEMQAMQAHPVLGDAIVAGLPLDGLEAIRGGVRHHHERWDGRGYPDRLSAEAIPLAARIIAVCDAYVAITVERSYRPARTAEAAREELLREAGHQFDPAVVAAFLEELDRPQVPEASSGGAQEDAAADLVEVAEYLTHLLTAAGEMR